MKGVMAKNIRMRKLLPSLREKKRYVAFEVISAKQFGQQEVVDAVHRSVLDLNGTFGAAIAGIYVPANLFHRERGIVRTSHKALDMVRAALCCIKSIGQDDVIVRSVGVSGSLKKAKRFVGG